MLICGSTNFYPNLFRFFSYKVNARGRGRGAILLLLSIYTQSCETQMTKAMAAMLVYLTKEVN